MSSARTLYSIAALLVLSAPLVETRRIQQKEQILRAGLAVETPHESVKEASASSEATDKFVCGALQSTYSACYPKERDWGLGSWAKAKACTTQCQRSMGMCYCPNSGESCTSAGSYDPGFHFFNVNSNTIEREFSDGHDFPNQPLLSRAVRVNPVTREWQYLATKQSGNVSTYHWQSPTKAGKSFLAANSFAKFDLLQSRNVSKTSSILDRILTEEGHSFPNDASSQKEPEVIMMPQLPANSCDPEQIAAFIQKQGI